MTPTAVTLEVEALLKEIQNAIGARALYPAEHPRTRSAVERIERALREVGGSGDLSIFMMNDRVVHDGIVLPGGEPIARGLFRMLRFYGYDRLTIRREVTREEIDTFVSLMAELAKRGDTGPRDKLRASANIRLSSFRASVRGVGAAPLTQDDFLSEEVELLGDVWTGVLERRALDLDAVEGIVLALSKTVEENIGAMIPMASLKSWDEYTGTHIINVALLAMALSECLGMPERVVHDIGIAALLHDVGKLQVSPTILNKPERLTREEFEEIKRHPEDGARILFSTPGVPELAVVVAYEHHVRFDGGGYPKVPPRWRLSLASGITQVADIYDALRTDRPYRRGLDRDLIMEMMVGDAGTHFDPDLLSSFFERVIPRAATVG